MRIASNVNNNINILLVSTNTCISSTTATILGHHNVKVCSCRPAATGNSLARDLFVYTRTVAAGNVKHNTYTIWVGIPEKLLNLGHTFNYMLFGIIHVYQCTS